MIVDVHTLVVPPARAGLFADPALDLAALADSARAFIGPAPAGSVSVPAAPACAQPRPPVRPDPQIGETA